MREFRWSERGLLLMLFSVGCSSAPSPLEGGRSPVAGGGAGQGTGDAGDNSAESTPNTEDPSEDTAADETPPPETTSDGTTSDGTTSDDTTAPGDPGGYWALVRSEDSQVPFAEEWIYDDAARLVKAREVRFRRDVDPIYAVDITITYDGNHVTSLHDRAPEEIVDLTHDYELRDGRIVEYEQVMLAGLAQEVDEVTDHQTFFYDDAGRLIGSDKTQSGDDAVWTLERRDGGEPARLLRNAEVACTYSWRHIWLGTTCYNSDGVESQTYVADASERLGSLTSDGSTVSYTYDDAGHLTLQASGTYIYEYRYSADAKLLESRGPDFEEVRSYDDAGRLREVRWSDAGYTSVTLFTYERLSADEVVQTETSPRGTVVRTYQRLSHPPAGEPQLPSYWSLLGMDQPTVYMKPADYAAVR